MQRQKGGIPSAKLNVVLVSLEGFKARAMVHRRHNDQKKKKKGGKKNEAYSRGNLESI